MPQDVDYEFGRTAVASGFLRQGELEDCVETMVALGRAGSGKRLWEVAARKGYLTQAQVEQVLAAIGGGARSSLAHDEGEGSSVIMDGVEGEGEEEGAGASWDISLDAEVEPVTDLWSRRQTDPLAMPPAPEETRVDLGPGKVRLRCVRGKDAGKVFVLAKTKSVIGRDATAEVVLGGVSVSRRHAEVVVGKRQVVVRDLGSRNGIQVRGVPVKESVLQIGETLRIGDSVLLLEWVVPAEASA